jgi:HrpA-like RNA helicase
LLIILKQLLSRRKDLKVVLMSATIDANLICSYFTCPMIEIPGFTYPVENRYLEDILAETDYKPESRKLKKGSEKSDDIDELGTDIAYRLNFMENALTYKIEYSLITKLVETICTSYPEGAILIFISGISEINRCIAQMSQQLSHLEDKMELLPLHSSLKSSEQQRVFKRPRAGRRKVVVATNIAETSITIDDVAYVIDTGRVKEMKLVDNVLSLQETWASKAACKQRRGRAGRVQSGICFKLFSRRFEARSMAKNTPPEILRLPLEQICLQIKSIGISNVHAFLLKAMDPPPEENINKAIESLLLVKAIDTRGQMTPLGKHISNIPTDLRIAKMIMYLS